MSTLFISHSSQNIAWCQGFVAALRAAGHTCFFDHDSIPGSVEWLDTIETGVQQCDLCVLVLSPVAWASQWVKREWQLALRLNKPILPVEYQSTPEANDGFLGLYQWVKAVGLDATATAQRTVTELTRLGYAPKEHYQEGFPTQLITPPILMQQFPIPARLARLGFVGEVIKDVEVIVPPICDVPAGTFTMGSDLQYDAQADDDEIPQYDIFVSNFQIGTYPLTVAEYACAVSVGAVKAPQTSTGISWQVQQRRVDHPVVCLTWLDAHDYATWLAQVTGHPWRLPTEAEWEKAARWDEAQQISRIYPWGDEWDRMKANTDDGGPKRTTPIGSYAELGDASPYGAKDMAGNVWEWTSSLYSKKYPYRYAKVEKDADISTGRVLRGGSWVSFQRNARTADRYWFKPSVFGTNVGVRLARGVASDT